MNMGDRVGIECGMGVGEARESNGEKYGTIVIEQQ